MTDAERDQRKEHALVKVLDALQAALVTYGPDATVAYNLLKAEQCVLAERRFVEKAWDA